jgi:type I restriction enzyme S subunit
VNLQDGRLGASRPEWPRLKLKHLSRLIGGGTTSKDDITYWVGGDVPWVSPKDMKRREIMETEDYITERAVLESATKKVRAGTVLMVTRSGILKHSLPIALAAVDLALNQDMKAFIFDHRLDPRFFVYWIEGQASQLLLEWRQLGATVDSIDIYKMMDSQIAVPPVDFQYDVVSFLNREIPKIDRQLNLLGGLNLARTASSGSMMKLLWEKRAALITAAVTGQIDVATWDKHGTADPRLDEIEAEIAGAASPEPEAMRA